LEFVHISRNNRESVGGKMPESNLTKENMMKYLEPSNITIRYFSLGKYKIIRKERSKACNIKNHQKYFSEKIRKSPKQYIVSDLCLNHFVD
jgi:hypothetical protein